MEQPQENNLQPKDEWTDLLLIADELKEQLSEVQPDPRFVSALRLRLIQSHPANQRETTGYTKDQQKNRGMWMINGLVKKLSQGVKDAFAPWLRKKRLVYKTSFQQKNVRLLFLTAACLLLLWIGTTFYGDMSSRAEAEAIMSRMEQASSLSSMNVRSYRAKIAYTENKADGTLLQSESLRWYRKTGEFRQETKVLKPHPFHRTIVASEGNFWSSDSQAVQVSIDGMAQAALDHLAGPYLGMESLEELVHLDSDAYKAQLWGEEKIAGRDCHILELKGKGKGKGKSLANGISRTRVWVDKETYFALRTEVYNQKDQLKSAQETLEITYNLPLDDQLFQREPHQREELGYSDPKKVTDAVPLTIHFSFTEDEYRPRKSVSYHISLQNESTQSIYLAKESPQLAIGEMKEVQSDVWSYPLSGLASAVIKPGERVEVTVSWQVEAPPGKYLIMLRNLSLIQNRKKQVYDVGLGGFFVP